jgi:hypothetical protein
LPATALLRGATQLLKQTQVVALRVQLHPDAHPDASLPSAQALLHAQGFALCGVESERNPHLGTALFVRDYLAKHSANREELDTLSQSHIQLQQEKETLQNANAQQLEQLTTQLQVEALARLTMEQQTAALARSKQDAVNANIQALAQVQALQDEKELLQNASAQKVAQLVAQLQAEALAHAQTHEAHLAQNTVLQHQAEELNAACSQLQAELYNLKQKSSELTQSLQNEGQAKVHALTVVQALQAEKAVLQQQRETLTQAKEDEAKVNAHQTQELHRQIADWQQRYAQLELEKQVIDKRFGLLREELIKSEAQLELIEDLLLKSPNI